MKGESEDEDEEEDEEDEEESSNPNFKDAIANISKFSTKELRKFMIVSAQRLQATQQEQVQQGQTEQTGSANKEDVIVEIAKCLHPNVEVSDFFFKLFMEKKFFGVSVSHLRDLVITMSSTAMCHVLARENASVDSADIFLYIQEQITADNCKRAEYEEDADLQNESWKEKISVFLPYSGKLLIMHTVAHKPMINEATNLPEPSIHYFADFSKSPYGHLLPYAEILTSVVPDDIDHVIGIYFCFDFASDTTPNRDDFYKMKIEHTRKMLVTLYTKQRENGIDPTRLSTIYVEYQKYLRSNLEQWAIKWDDTEAQFDLNLPSDEVFVGIHSFPTAGERKKFDALFFNAVAAPAPFSSSAAAPSSTAASSATAAPLSSIEVEEGAPKVGAPNSGRFNRTKKNAKKARKKGSEEMKKSSENTSTGTVAAGSPGTIAAGPCSLVEDCIAREFPMQGYKCRLCHVVLHTQCGKNVGEDGEIECPDGKGCNQFKAYNNSAGRAGKKKPPAKKGTTKSKTSKPRICNSGDFCEAPGKNVAQKAHVCPHCQKPKHRTCGIELTEMPGHNKHKICHPCYEKAEATATNQSSHNACSASEAQAEASDAGINQEEDLMQATSDNELSTKKEDSQSTTAASISQKKGSTEENRSTKRSRASECERDTPQQQNPRKKKKDNKRTSNKSSAEPPASSTRSKAADYQLEHLKF